MWSMSVVIPFFLVLQALSQPEYITVNTTSGKLSGIQDDGGELCLDCYLWSVFLTPTDV
jgi:hypothetical protein